MSKRRDALQRQLERGERRLAALQSRSATFSRLRLILFFVGAGLGIASYYLINTTLGWTVLGTTLVAFNMVAWVHRRIQRAIQRHEIWIEIKTTQLARLNLDWQHLPTPHITFPDESHPFARDLDIVGPQALHRLLDTAISRNGSQRLLDWLLATEPNLDVVRARQAVVRELTPLSRFRDKLQLVFKIVSKEPLESQRLLTFLQQQQPLPTLRKLVLLSAGLAAVTLALFVLNMLGLLPAFWIAPLTIYAAIYFMNENLLKSLLEEAEAITDELHKFKAVLMFLESYGYNNHPKLKEQCRVFLEAETRPSRQLRRILGISTAIGLRMNPLMRIILNLPLPWDFFFALRLNQFKSRLKQSLPDWLDALFELEALISLANYAFLNPDTTFPRLADDSSRDEPVFTARGLGHPLIPHAQKVRNDFQFGKAGEIALITGSNMSGKSTFLKTVGINLSLAFAGSAVDAASLHTSSLRVFTCIKINDSVTDGFSFFYAEVRRLKRLLQVLQEVTPVLFLIDEIFRGTNNRERLIGSRSYIESLAHQNGLGLISTHDLELTSLADEIPTVINYHFREDVKGGKMVFDYKLRSGPCPTTNALKIMKMEGLPVPGSA